MEHVKTKHFWQEMEMILESFISVDDGNRRYVNHWYTPAHYGDL